MEKRFTIRSRVFFLFKMKINWSWRMKSNGCRVKLVGPVGQLIDWIFPSIFFSSLDFSWDTYLAMSDVQIHWFSIVNSVIVVFFLAGILSMIIIRTLRRDIARYNEEDAVSFFDRFFRIFSSFSFRTTWRKKPDGNCSLKKENFRFESFVRFFLEFTATFFDLHARKTF